MKIKGIGDKEASSRQRDKVNDATGSIKKSKASL